MRNKILLLWILVLVFVAFIGARFFLLDKQNEYGKLKVVSSPSTNIFINSTFAGKSPFEDKYKTGEYILKLIPEGVATETASWQGKIKIYKNALTYVNQELGSSDITTGGEVFTTTKMDKPPKNGGYGEIFVESDPAGAIVYLDNDEKGVAPLRMEDVVKGDHELAVYMPGFLRRTQKINVDPGFRVNAAFKLAIDPTSQTQKIEKKPEATKSADLKVEKKSVLIKDTPLGFLRVRQEPIVNATEAARVKPGERFDLLDEQPNWYKIKIASQEGWVSAEYSSKE